MADCQFSWGLTTRPNGFDSRLSSAQLPAGARSYNWPTVYITGCDSHAMESSRTDGEPAKECLMKISGLQIHCIFGISWDLN